MLEVSSILIPRVLIEKISPFYMLHAAGAMNNSLSGILSAFMHVIESALAPVLSAPPPWVGPSGN